MKLLPPFLSGFIFALGLGIGGMTRPEKVIGFLDVANWDPALIFVMVGAMSTYALAFRFIMKRGNTLSGAPLQVPTTKKIDKKLVGGAMLFGIGWGIAGYCPGPALASVPTIDPGVIVFVAAMLAGMVLQHRITAFR